MFEKIKLAIKRLICQHDMDIVRWHRVHYPDYEPLCTEIEYKCKKCGKIVYNHLRGKEGYEWAETMGNYKKQ